VALEREAADRLKTTIFVVIFRDKRTNALVVTSNKLKNSRA
jgi:hypothetical protein